MAISKYYITGSELNEFKLLVAECKDCGFTMSYQVSRYIVNNRLGYKYRHIAGDLHLRNSYDQWIYKGGIAPKYYRMLCIELGLGNKHSDAEVEKFRSYAEMGLFDNYAA